MKYSFLLILLAALCGVGFSAGCDDSDSTSTGDPQSTDETTDTADTSDDTDTDTEGPYAYIDCAGKQGDPLTCENKLCPIITTYSNNVSACEAAPSEECNGTLACFETYIECMLVACPPKTAQPQTHDEKSEAGFYDCDQDLTDCNLANM